MKNNNKIGLLLMFAALSFSSCADDLKDLMYIDKFAKILYLKNSGEENVTLYKVTESSEMSLSVIKTGNDPAATATGQIRVLTQAEIDIFNEEYGTVYSIIPSSCYKLENTDLNFESSDQYHFPKLIFNNQEIDNYISTQPDDKVYVIPIGLFSETDSVNAAMNSCIYKPVVKTPALLFETDKVLLSTVVPKSGGNIEIPMILEVDENLWDFDVEFEIDESSVTDPTQLMNKENYSLTGDGIISFKKGESKKILNVSISEMKTSFGIIPLKIKQITMAGFDIDPRTLQVEVELRYPLTIEEMFTNAQEPSEGKLENVLDRDISTYFHSAWSKEIPEKHYLQLNLKESMSAMAFTYTNRANNGNAALNNFDVSISSDGVTFELVNNYTKGQDNLPMSGAGVFKSELLVFNKTVKYVRFTCNASGTANNKYFVWSEFAITDYVSGN